MSRTRALCQPKPGTRAMPHLRAWTPCADFPWTPQQETARHHCLPYHRHAAAPRMVKAKPRLTQSLTSQWTVAWYALGVWASNAPSKSARRFSLYSLGHYFQGEACAVGCGLTTAFVLLVKCF